MTLPARARVRARALRASRPLLAVLACAAGALADSAAVSLRGTVPTGVYAFVTPTSVPASLVLPPGKATTLHALGAVSAYGNAPFVITAEVQGGTLSSPAGNTVPAEVALVSPGAPPSGFKAVDKLELAATPELTHVADLWLRVKTKKHQPGGLYAGTVVLTAAPR